MSAEATFWAWQQGVKSTHKLVLLSLANCHNEANGQCNPSIAYIAQSTGLNRKTVITAMEHLEESSLIIRAKSTGSSNQFTLNFGQITSTKNGTSPKSGPGPKTDITSPKNGTGPVPKTDHESKKNLKEPKNINRGLDFSSWPTEPGKEVLQDWKKVRKAPLTQTAVNQIAKQFHLASQHGYSVDHCLAICCERGWRGFQFQWLLNHENQGQQPHAQSMHQGRTRDRSVTEILTDTNW
ncbi:helix-turn-helix domain-containing protein [Microbulbifer sp. MLAF003]|uniref:helix-turn-helix domain-containing protein n=1 Tax=Microbulbifer sp. MLAF003 TaxID=3032582 RepID=UPI0024ACE143|nr:helix-turn-helix domain-containing protein [Microbulbifer sp. MLAF003]WHI52693.1 helix-turn-helix domain-containing protein [Microbulbifer sp. MLAF003]